MLRVRIVNIKAENPTNKDNVAWRNICSRVVGSVIVVVLTIILTAFLLLGLTVNALPTTNYRYIDNRFD